MPPSRTIRRIVVTASALCALVALSAGAAIAADQSVSISGFAFNPATVTVNVGDSVTWTNNDDVPHTATADNGSFNTGQLGSGDSDSVTFNNAGTFAYHCSVHPSMDGTVVVRATAGGGGGGGGAPTQPQTDTAAPSAVRADQPGAPLGALLAAGAIGALLSIRLLRRRA
jgi:plastocyanin